METRKKLVLNAVLVLLAIAGITSLRAETTVTSYVTFYGWLDNDPPGAGIAYPDIHSTAGGTGTFSNPVTFATDAAEIAPGSKIYVSFLKKYFIMEDECAQCITDWNKSKKRHVDLWTGGKSSSGSALINCEDSLTRTTSIILSPASTHTVVTTALFNTSTNKCYVP